jgi:O-antigen ligase
MVAPKKETSFNKKAFIFIQLVLLSLMLISLPSIEAPKNIFLVFFVSVAAFYQIKTADINSISKWDFIFITFILTALLSSIFAGLSPGSEWGGFQVVLTYIMTGWLISRSPFTKKQIAYLFIITILSTLPALFWGLTEYLYLHTEIDLKLHSVGHVNHSAIYLTIIFGSTVGLGISLWDDLNKFQKGVFLALSGILYASLILSRSRAAVGVGFILAVLLVMLLSKNARNIIYSLVLIAIAALLAFLLNAEVIQKQIGLQNNHNFLADRDLVWNVPLEASRLYPLLGIGMNNWKKIKLEDLKESVEKRNETFKEGNYILKVGHAHNLYLQTLLEKGILGALALFIFMFGWLEQLRSSFYINKTDNQARYLWAGSFSAWIVTFGIGFVNSTLHHEHGILACVLLGLHLSYLYNLKNKIG